MINDFLPNMRGLVSHELREKGQSQRKIASMLGITQARVSYYLRRRKSLFATEIATKFGIPAVDTNNYSKLLAEDVARSQTDGIFTLYSIWKNLLFNGMMCAAHQKNANVPPDCTVCMQVFKPAREKDISSGEESKDIEIIRDVGQAVSMLESSVYFPVVMPAVSVNIAMSRETPKTVGDVAAVPGRINKIHGRARAFVMPEFGSSNHMSKVLLLANSREREFRAVMNIKYDDSIGKALDELGIPKRYTAAIRSQHGAHIEKAELGDPVLQRLAQARMSLDDDSSILAIVDRGSEGFEPMTYLLGRKASELSQAALRIAQAYS